MRYLLGIAAIVVAGFLIWQIGARLSTDAVGMGMGLVFGMLAGIPAALLVLATGRQSQGGGYDAGYSAGTRDAQRAEFEWAAARLVERQSAELQQGQRPAVIVVNPPVPQYTPARPFAIQPALKTHCANWELCPDCHLPITPDEHCAEWCGVQPFGRQFRIVGEVE